MTPALPMLFATDWHAACLDALDLMRDDPHAGRLRGQALLEQSAGDAPATLAAQLVLAFADHYEHRIDAASAEFSRLAPLVEAGGDRGCEKLCLFGLIVSWRQQSRLADAYALGRERLLPLLDASASRENIIAYNALGIVAHECGHTEEAIGHFYAALEAARRLDLPARIAHICANIGEIFYVSCNAADAEQMLTEALEVGRRAAEPWILPFISTLLALSRLALEKYDEAYALIVDYLPESAAEAPGAAQGGIDISHRVFYLSVAAYTVAQRGQLDEADALNRRAHALLARGEDRRLAPYTWWASGHLHHLRGRYAEAIAELNRAIDLIGDRGYLYMPLHAMEELARIHEKQQDWQRAYREMQRFHALSMRAQSQSASVRLETLRIRSEIKEADIARRHAEESLAERDIILDNAMVAIVFLNEEGRVVWANQAMYQMFRAPPGDYAGISLKQFYPSEDEYYRVGAEVNAAMRAGRPFEDERQMRRADGSLFWAYTSGRAVNWHDASRGTVWAAMDISKRRELEAELTRSQENYRKVVENAAEGIMVTQDGVIVFANSRVHDLYGAPPEKMIGMSFAGIIHPDDIGELMASHMRRMQGADERHATTFRVNHYSTGKQIWAEAITVTIEWEGRPASLSFMTDVSARKQLEDSLKRSLAERDTILENSIVGITLLKPDGRVQWANRAMQEMFGVSESNYLGRSLEHFYPSREAYIETGEAVTSAVCRGENFAVELEMRREDGTPFWAFLSGRAVNASDLSEGTVWAVMDITQRRRLEQDLSKSEEHYRLLINNVTECIIVVQDGHVVFANPRVLELTGYGAEIYEVPFMDGVHPDDRAEVAARHVRRLAGERLDQHYQFRLISKYDPSTPIWVELSGVMIEWEGRPATLSFMTDVTERRSLEESLKHSMEERMRLQTLQIETELREAEIARQLAEETTRAKSMFLANMSHEIRTPMNAIIGMAHLALRTELNNKQRDYIEKIHGAGVSLLGILNDILDFSKVEAGKIEMEHVEFNLDRVFDNVSAVTSGNAYEKDLEYLLQVSPGVPRNLMGDPLRLGQVLINLVNNAIKFTDVGEICVACQQHALRSGRIELEFIVRDTGIGMTQEQADQLFQPFMQADGSTTRRYGGTGLGLSICKGMVDLMDGRIWLETEAGAGTTVHFTAMFDPAPAQPARQLVPQAINGTRILVVDDNPVARMILAENLSTLPVAVDVAAGGEEALAMVQAADNDHPYGIVFSDVRMPGMDGFALARQIKQPGALRSPPKVVLVSAYGRDEVGNVGPVGRADAFLAKPVNASGLYDTMLDLLAPDVRVARVTANVAVPTFRDLTVLLVEDNEINQQIAAELMEAAGVRTDIARNGRVALEMLAARPADHYGAILMDVQMPEMDGHEATRRIRADARIAELPVIAMTAHALLEERARCAASGMDDHISKPINPAELFEMLSRWCPLNAYQAVQQEVAIAAPGDLLIEGIDTAEGLQRTLGNRTFYLDMLARFREGQRYAVAEIRAALHQDDITQAEQITHTLKGVAGQLGARGIHALAAQLEQCLHEGAAEAQCEPLLERLGREMAAIDAALAPVLARAAEDAAPSPAPADAADDESALLDRLRQMLVESDGEAVDLLQELGSLVEARLGSDAAKRLARAVRQYDYDTALSLLAAAAPGNMQRKAP